MFVQLAALVHFFRRRPEWYWFYVILIGGALDSVIYFFAEVVPDFDLARASIQRYGRRSRIAIAEATARENSSVANLEGLGELYLDQRRYATAREAFDHAIDTRRMRRAPSIFAASAKCSCANGTMRTPDEAARIRAEDERLDRLFCEAASRTTKSRRTLPAAGRSPNTRRSWKAGRSEARAARAASTCFPPKACMWRIHDNQRCRCRSKHRKDY
jgi:hypothetical protein